MMRSCPQGTEQDTPGSGCGLLVFRMGGRSLPEQVVWLGQQGAGQSMGFRGWLPTHLGACDLRVVRSGGRKLDAIAPWDVKPRYKWPECLLGRELPHTPK